MMKKDLFDIIREKSFEELTPAERAEVAEMAVDEVAYTDLKGFMEEVDVVASEKVVPASRVKGDLDDLFDQVHGQRKYAWYMSFAAVIVPKEKPLYKQPLFYAAAVLLLALLIVPLANKNLSNTSQVLAENEIFKEEVVVSNERGFEEAPVSTNVETRILNEQTKAEVVMEDGEGLSDLMPIELVAAEEQEMAEAEESVIEFDIGIAAAPSATVSSTMAGSHPDGVFEDWASESNFSVPASRQPELLDLLTATF